MEKTITYKAVQKVIGLERIPSTQILARSLSTQETDGTLILACQQTAAIDREGNNFYALAIVYFCHIRYLLYQNPDTPRPDTFSEPRRPYRAGIFSVISQSLSIGRSAGHANGRIPPRRLVQTVSCNKSACRSFAF